MRRTKENLNRCGTTDDANYGCGEKQISSHLLKCIFTPIEDMR